MYFTSGFFFGLRLNFLINSEILRTVCSFHPRYSMTEEEAIFTLGKRLSNLYHEGEDLPNEKFRVGNSWVEPRELMEAYEKHHPPVGPRKVKQVTDRIFTYRLADDAYKTWEYRGELIGVEITCGSENYPVLRSADLFRLGETKLMEERIRTSDDNRYDIIEGANFTFVIDKLRNRISVNKLKFRFNGPGYSTFYEETPVWGSEMTSITLADDPFKRSKSVQFPFIPFDLFWGELNRYMNMRRVQIGKMIDDDSSAGILPP
jgi:hypothetical protein